MAWAMQSILDQIALVCGGAAVPARDGVYSGAGGIQDIAIAYSKPLAAPEKLPAVIVLPGAGDQVEPEGSLEQWKHRMRIWVLIGQSEAGWEAAMTKATSFIDRFRTAFLTATLGGGADGGCYLERYDLGRTLVFAGRPYFGIEWTLLAIEEEAVTRVA